MLTVQKNEPWVGRLYNLLNLLWKTYHYSPNAQWELKAVAEMLGVNVCNNSSVKGNCLSPSSGEGSYFLLLICQEDMSWMLFVFLTFFQNKDFIFIQRDSIPHVQRVLHVLLKDNGGEEEDSGQYAATLQHMSHLAASSPSSEIKGRANKVNGKGTACFRFLNCVALRNHVLFYSLKNVFRSKQQWRVHSSVPSAILWLISSLCLGA